MKRCLVGLVVVCVLGSQANAFWGMTRHTQSDVAKKRLPIELRVVEGASKQVTVLYTITPTGKFQLLRDVKLHIGDDKKSLMSMRLATVALPFAVGDDTPDGQPITGRFTIHIDLLPKTVIDLDVQYAVGNLTDGHTYRMAVESFLEKKK